MSAPEPGAAVPGQAAHPRCPHDHVKWGRDMAMDRIPSRYGGGWGCPGILTDGTDCGYELDANGRPRLAAAAPEPQPAPGALVVRFRDEHGQILAETRFSPDADRKIAIPLDAEHMQVRAEAQPAPGPTAADLMAAHKEGRTAWAAVDQLRGQLAALRSGIAAYVDELKTSAASTHPSKKSQIQFDVIRKLESILEGK